MSRILFDSNGLPLSTTAAFQSVLTPVDNTGLDTPQIFVAVRQPDIADRNGHLLEVDEA